MQYSNILYLIVVTISLNHTILSMSKLYRPTTATQAITKNIAPYDLQQLYKNMTNLYTTWNLSYNKIMRHPFVHPIYAGYKGSTASAELRDYMTTAYDHYQQRTLGAHTYFKAFLFDPWIQHLKKTRMYQLFAQDIENYNQAFIHYLKNPNDPNAHQQLIEQSRHIFNRMKETPTSKNPRLPLYKTPAKKISPTQHLQERHHQPEEAEDLYQYEFLFDYGIF